MGAEVFISYADGDRGVALAACRALEEEGVSCWVAARDVPGGAAWAEEVTAALSEADVLLLILSSRANASEHVAREVAYAGERDLRFIALQIEDVEPAGRLSFFVRPTHWLAATEPPLARHLSRLAASVRRLQRARGAGGSAIRGRRAFAPGYEAGEEITAGPAQKITLGAAIVLGLASLTPWFGLMFAPAAMFLGWREGKRVDERGYHSGELRALAHGSVLAGAAGLAWNVYYILTVFLLALMKNR